ncbi:MAG TPA: hypothetical protein VFO76_13855, partial [Candidatus Kapabacteria bacterium]|nr:hypothetical protein [Candidatus Kapabacteria bacterium]
ALPSFSLIQRITIDLQHPDQVGREDTVRAVLVRFGRSEDAQFDTFYLDNDHESFGRSMWIDRLPTSVKIHWRNVKWCQIKLLVLSNGKLLESPVLTDPDMMESYFVLTIGPHSIIDSSPYFKVKWGVFFLELVFLLAIELVVATILLGRWKFLNKRNMVVIVTATLVSYLAIWILCTHLIGFGWAYVIAEVCAIIFQAWWFRRFLTERFTLDRSVRLSLYLNGWSFIITELLLVFIRG